MFLILGSGASIVPVAWLSEVATTFTLRISSLRIIGLLLLAQIPTFMQIVGIVLVIFAGAAAQRGGVRMSAD